MELSITRRKTPEEEELEKKLAELAVLEAELVQRELDLATLLAELHIFEREYLRVVGVRYAQLDELEAEIAKYQAFLNPKDHATRQQAEQAWTKAQNSKRNVDENVTNNEPSKDFKPSENLKKLYWEVAKRLHPDLTTNQVERIRRHQFMAEVNQAYEDGNEQRLQTILQEWENSPDSVSGEGIEVELIRTIRKIAQVRERLKTIEAEIVDLKHSALHQLQEKVIAAQQEKRVLLAEMAFQIAEQITAAKVQLEEIRVKVGF